MIPKITGFAGDLFVPSKKYMQLTSGYSNRPELKGLVAIADLFLLHDIVSFRAELWTIRELYSCFTMDEMDEMLNNKRISFFLPIYQRGYKKDWLAKIEEKLTKLPEILFKGKFDGSRVTKQIADNLIEQKSFDENFQEFDSTMKELFYKHGIQRDSFFSMDVQIGFDQAIEKIRELWSCGIFSSTLDEEVLFYFDICDKAAYLKENNLPFSDLNNSSRQLVDQLHNFKNCPSLGQILTNSPNPTKSMIEIVNSNEANDLKIWLQNNLDKDVDVRDLYNSTISKLPSKNVWTDWLRFGGVTVVTGILGTIVTANPVVGIAIGGAGGALDKLYGDKAINATSKNYNPEAWFRFIKNTAANNGSQPMRVSEG